MSTEPQGARADVAGVILAGGLARRMGGRPKALIELDGKPLAAHALERLAPQAGAVALNANADGERLAALGAPVIRDTVEGFAGPLAGVLAGMLWARKAAPEARWLVSVAVDTPFFPADLAARFIEAVTESDAQMAVAASNGRAHPVFGLWPIAMAEELQAALVGEGLRKIDLFTARYRLVQVDFGHGRADPFFNINRPEDLQQAQRRIEAQLAP